MGKGGWRISKPLSYAHLQSGGTKPRSNCVERMKLGKGHHFHFSLGAEPLPREGKEIRASRSPPTRIRCALAQFRQTPTSRAGARLQETLPPPSCPSTPRPCGNVSSLPAEPW